jgi:hypothetical protein
MTEINRNLPETSQTLWAGWGERYKDKLKAWWFDSPYVLDSRGPHNSVSTDMTGFQFPWEKFTVTAKLGYPGRLVTYNPGVAETFLYTTHQDYWSGERVNLKAPASSRYLDNGLQWFGWTCLEDRAWVHRRVNTEIPKLLFGSGGRCVCAGVQCPSGSDDFQRRDLPGWTDGRSVCGAVAPAERGTEMTQVNQRTTDCQAASILRVCQRITFSKPVNFAIHGPRHGKTERHQDHIRRSNGC